MNEIAVPDQNLPIKFPDWRDEMFSRAQEFRRLTPEARVAALFDVIAAGARMLEISPKRDVADRLFAEREAEWQRIQREVFSRG